MKNSIYIILAIVLIFSTSCEVELFSCLKEEGSIETRTINLDDITGFELDIEGDIELKEGDSQEIKIEGHPNIIDKLLEDSKISGDTWEIDIDGCTSISKLKFFITLPTVEKATINGSGTIVTPNVFNNIDKINLEIDGAGDIDFKLSTVEKVDLEIKGDGKIIVSGETDELSIDIAGSGDVRSSNLEASSAKIDISGSGDCEVNVLDFLRIDISGTGRVCYQGNPQIDQDTSGVGEIVDCN